MIINFYPEHDSLKLEKAAKEYESIWKKEGNKITDIIEKASGLKFKEKIINAVVCNEVSYSIPLKLQSDISRVHKEGSLTHELCHRIVVGNDFMVKSGRSHNNWAMAVHKHIDLVLYDILVELYGKDFAKKEIDFEISLWAGKDISPYKIAWDWALAMTKEERQVLWKNTVKNRQFQG